MDGYDHRTYGESFADIYDDWYSNVTDTEACVAAVETLARRISQRDRPLVLELGVGTGRLAAPLAATGLDVRGIDSSPAMLERLRARSDIPVIEGDFADIRVPARHNDDGPAPDLVLCAYNTLFNLTSAEAQRRAMASVATALAPAGLFVVEAFVPPDEAQHDDSVVRVRHLEVQRVVLSASVHDPAAQTISGQYVELSEEGTRLRPWHLHYLWPAQMDEMAAAAGMTLQHRWADWDATPFEPHHASHISVYAAAGQRSDI